jgi:hypothetical protein
MKGLSNTQRTLRYLREQGVICEIVERWLSYGGKFGVRKDLFSFIDILCLWPGEGIVGVQSCAGSTHLKHKRKIYEECRELFEEWLKYNGKVKLISWSKKKLKRGGKALRWMPRIEELEKGWLE